MRLRKATGFFLISASLIAAGCGGSSSITPSPAASGTVGFSGSTTVTSSPTAPATVPASGGVTVSTGDSSTGNTAVIPSGAVPAGTTVDSNTILAIIPAGTGFPGSFGGSSMMTVNGNAQSGVGVSAAGTTVVNTALPVAQGPNGTLYTLAFPPGDIDTNIVKRANTLTIRNTSFTGRYYVLTNPTRVVSPVATALSGRIPNNGQNAVGSVVLAVFGPGNNGRSATLSIDYGNGFALSQRRTIASNSVTFSDITYDRVSVPATGVALVSLAIGDLP